MGIGERGTECMSLNECMNRMHVPQCCLNFATMAALCSDNILRNYDPSAELVLQCDASSVKVGAVLLQPGNDGSLQPVAYASRTLIHVERNYAPIERESLAIVFGVTKFRQYFTRQAFQTTHGSQAYDNTIRGT